MLSLVTAVILTIGSVFYEAPQPTGDFGDKGQCAAPVVADASGDSVSDPCAASETDTFSPMY